MNSDFHCERRVGKRERERSGGKGEEETYNFPASYSSLQSAKYVKSIKYVPINFAISITQNVIAFLRRI